MSFEVKNIEIKSSDNIHTLKGKAYVPTGEIKGIFHLVHGMTEYIDRYDFLFGAIAESGFIAAGFDNLGHGKTALDDAELGFIAHKNGWRFLVDDVINFGYELKKLYPQKYLYLMGHSMGSFIARLCFEKEQNLYKKVIFCGTAAKNPLAKMGLLLTNTIKLFKGERYISNLCNTIAFGSYNKKFGNASEYEWLTSDREIIKKYAKDEFCAFKFSVSALNDLIKLIDLCNRREWFEKTPVNTPILLISGDMDPVGNYGKGIKQIHNKLSVKHNAQMKLYTNARHEIHNDFCRSEVISDIIKFLKSEK